MTRPTMESAIDGEKLQRKFEKRTNKEKKARADATAIVISAAKNDPQAAAELLPLVYDQLRRLAAKYLAGKRSDHTLQATALVHEA